MKKIMILILLILLKQWATFQFNVFYSGSPTLEIHQAIVAATQNIQQFLNLTQDINVAISFANLPQNILAQSTPSRVCLHPDTVNFPHVLVPDALYSQLTKTPNCPYASDDIHIFTTVNNNPEFPFYYGLDGTTPSGMFDFVTVMMHEMDHGLGFSSYIDQFGGNYFAPDASIFDWYTFSGVAGWPTSFLDPVSSPAITDLSVMTDDSLFFNGTAPFSYFQLYTPPVFVVGSSISHTAAPGLMYYRLARGVSYHVLDAYLVGMLTTFGYDTTNCDVPNTNLCGNCLHNYPCSPSTSFSPTFSGFLFDWL